MQRAGDVPALEAPTIERKTAREQQLFLLKYLYQGVLLTCVVMAMVVLVLWNELDHGRLLAWYGIVVAISLLRLLLLRRRPGLLAADGPDEVVHLGLHTGAFASALVCSAAVFLAGQSTQPGDLMIIIALLGGMAAGALGTLGAIVSVYNLYLFTLLTPSVFWLLQSGDESGRTLALMAMVFLGSMLVAGRGYGARLAQSYRLQFRNIILNRNLSRTGTEAVENGRKLQREVAQRREAEAKIKATAQRLQQANQYLQTQIRERQKIEAAVRRQAVEIARSETRLRAVIGNSFDGILTTAQDGSILTANPAAQRLLGAAEKQLSGRPLGQLLPGLSFASANLSRQELWVKRGRQGKIPVSFAAAPLGQTGEQGYVCVLRDETAAEAARQALLSAKEAAESANRAKSEFLSSMSHELRTPLNAILGYAQLLEADPANPLSEAQKSSTSEINKAGWHLLNLINDVLDLAQIEAGRLEIRREEVVVSELVADAVTLLAPLAADYEVTVEDEIQATGLKVYADPMRLKQVVINLLSNAIKYNRPGGRVVIESPDCSARQCRLVVKDTGIGLTPAQQEKVFDRFSRVADKKADIEGAGIGLAVTQKLVHGMGGEIGVRSKPGVGSSFWVDLPAVVDDSPARRVALSS